MEMERLNHLFERSCDAWRTRIAIDTGTEKLTYGELDKRANRLARYLLGVGARPDDCIAIHLRRSIDTYVSMLAILKINAVYVPLDPEFPVERKRFIIQDAGVSTIISTSDLGFDLGKTVTQEVCLDTIGDRLLELPSSRIADDELPKSCDNLCYIIYTSGTTGKPKGVMIEHPSICNFVKVAAKTYGIKSTDRVYQGMTIAFDFSVEEIWVPLVAGATIVPGPNDCRRIGPELTEFLARHRITVFCCVPTLLETMENNIPTLRLLIVGGEACSAELVRRWSRPDLKILNTYGPTETTVTASWCELRPGKRVTIGRPLPTYEIYILDEELRQVPLGEIGEICIGGIGVARGYLNRDELTAEKFVTIPLESDSNVNKRIYRSGDLGRITGDGEIEYLGRIDTQVKIRGYRIELSEIESLILSVSDVERAVVSLWEPTEGSPELVAYLTVKRNSSMDESELRTAVYELLRKKLPSYMIPSYLEIVDDIPTLPSGKVDRSSLPAPSRNRFASRRKEVVPPSNPVEEKLARIFAETLGLQTVSVEDDFFEDLGGHSLLAARLVSALRRDPCFSSVNLADIYRFPSVKALARAFPCEETSDIPGIPVGSCENVSEAQNRKIAPDWKVWLSGIAQATSLFLYVALLALPGLAFFKKALLVFEKNPEVSGTFTLLLLAGFGVTFIWSLFLPIAFKWILLGKTRPRSHSLWGWFFLRWWLVQKMIALAPLGFLNGTPLLNYFARLMGAKIGKDCVIRTHLLHVFDMIEIGDDTCIGDSTHIFGYQVSDGTLHLQKVVIGNGCFIGSNSVVMPGSRMEDESWLGDQSLLPEGVTIGHGEVWLGSPASAQEEINPEILEFLRTPRRKAGRLVAMAMVAGFVVAVIGSVMIPLLAVFPGVLLIGVVYKCLGGCWYLLVTPVAGLSFVLSLCALVILAKWLVLPEIRPGIYPVKSPFYLRKWFVDRGMRMSLEFLDSLYATLYLPPFLKMLGTKIGKWAEISTIAHITPDLLEIDDESFVADAAHVGPVCVYRGLIRVRPTRIGRRTFVGNSAFVPEGTSLPDECLIGVLSVPPKGDIREGTTWLGSPAIFLPRREESQPFPEWETFRPTRRLYIQRLFYEYFRVTLPSTLHFLAMSIIYPAMLFLLNSVALPLAALGISILLGIASLGETLVVLGIKKSLIGTYIPRVKPLWNEFVRKTELVTGLYENVVVPAFLLQFTGTPFAPVIMRMLGAKVGRRCYIETTFMTEFDLVEIGDDCDIGVACSLQTHLFEDRVMKMSRLKIGNGCSIGPRAVILYDSVLEDGVRLDALSLVMKGEILPSNTHWCGAPAQRRDCIDGALLNEGKKKEGLPLLSDHGETVFDCTMTH